MSFFFFEYFKHLVMEQCPLAKIGDTMPAGSSSAVMDRINNMITDNFVSLAVMTVLIIVLFALLGYFSYSLISTVLDYYKNKNIPEVGTAKTDSILDKSADNEVYEDSDEQNVSKVDPKKFMPKAKRDFLDQLELENTLYNKETTDKLTKQLKYPENDDLINEKILYKKYDDYKYKYEKD